MQGESPWVRPVFDGDARLDGQTVHWSNNVE